MEEIILQSNLKFNGNFDFTNTIYKNWKTKITFICKKHNNPITILGFAHIKQKFGGCSICENETNMIKIILDKDEIIKDVNIDKYRELYSVTNFGRCFSKKRNKELSTRLNSGYKRVGFWINNYTVKKNVKVHRIVYITFGGEIEKGKVIDHIDGDKLNNRIDNLQCVTQSENMNNAYKNKNTNIHREREVQIFDKSGNFIQEFKSIKNAAAFLNIKDRSCIYKCLNGKSKFRYGYSWKYKDDKITEQKFNCHIKDIDEYVSIGILDDHDFSQYFINKDGIMVNTEFNNRIIKHRLDLNNYVIVHLTSSTLKNKMFKLHRLLGRCFLKNGDKFYHDKSFVINHKDENRNNNSLDNLEWIFQHENIIYSCGKKVAQLDKITENIIKVFDSIASANKYINNLPNNPSIRRVCRKTQVSAYGFKWKFI
jgi:HNH endonuclease/NUMOD1 domain